jgi:glycosyltransferase involved in cell wall biosynthesis
MGHEMEQNMTEETGAEIESASNEKISIIIPLYKEEENIDMLVERINPVLQNLISAEVIFVDDGSKDNTFALLQKYAERNKKIKVIGFVRNSGQTSAIQAGIDHASGNIFVFMDGDLQNDPDDIPAIINKLSEGYDVVSGWRKNRKDNAIKRNLPSHVANWLISRISGVHLHDYGCTLKAYRRSVLKNVRLYGEMHRFIPIYAVWQGAHVIEMPVTHHARQFGKSKYGLERIFKVLLDICVIKFLDKYLTKPIYIFGGFGIFAFSLSVIAFIWSFVLKIFFSTSLIQTPLPLFGSIAILISIMCFLMGLLAEVMSRTYFESQSRKPYTIGKTLNVPPSPHENTEGNNKCAELLVFADRVIKIR